MPSKERKKKEPKAAAAAAAPAAAVLAVRANVDAFDEASIIIEPATVSAEVAQHAHDNVIMKLTFGDNVSMTPDAYQSYQTDFISSAQGTDLDCFSLTSGQACLIQDVFGQNKGPPLSAPVAPFGAMAAPADVSTWNASTATMPQAVPHQYSAPGSKVVRLLAEFEEKGKSGEWPLSTSVHCYWCSHRFDTPPVGLPIKYVHQTGKFQTIGCFCSLQCACAYNFDNNRDSEDECMARYSLLNALSSKLGCGRVVKPAPSRLALSMFGGHMSIDEFRAYGNARATAGVQRQIIINCPPMQSLTQQVEDISESDMSSEYRYVPLDNDRVQRYQEKVRLQRTKPLSDIKNTLDRTMKLKYNA